MIDSIFNQFNIIFNQIWTWIQAIDQKIPFLKIVLGLFLVHAIMRFIIFPILKPGIGGAGSDQALSRDDLERRYNSERAYKNYKYERKKLGK